MNWHIKHFYRASLLSAGNKIQLPPSMSACGNCKPFFAHFRQFSRFFCRVHGSCTFYLAANFTQSGTGANQEDEILTFWPPVITKFGGPHFAHTAPALYNYTKTSLSNFALTNNTHTHTVAYYHLRA